jgi:hypothetical protein
MMRLRVRRMSRALLALVCLAGCSAPSKPVMGTIFDAEIRTIDDLWDRRTGEFYVPAAEAFAPRKADAERRNLRHGTCQGPDADARVAVLDTGVLPEHPWLKDRIVELIDLTGEGIEDRNGHGTAVALLMVGPPELQLPGCLVVVKVADRHGRVEEATLREGIRAAVDRGAVWLNLSLGFPYGPERAPELCGQLASLGDHDPPVIVTAAAGNWGPSVPVVPAQCPGDHIIAVGALDEQGRPAPYSGQGEEYQPGRIRFIPVPATPQEG